MTKFTLFQMLELLAQHPKLIFNRVNDPNFKVKRGYLGDVLIDIKGNISVMKIFNYVQDLFVIDEKDSKE